MTDSPFNGLPVEIGAEAFGDPWVFEPFGHDEGTIRQALPRLVAAAQLVEPLGLARRAVQPLPQDEPPAMLIEHDGVVMLLRMATGRPELASVWPRIQFTTELTRPVERLILSPDRTQAMIRIDLDEDQRLCFEDTRFAVMRGAYRAGRPITFVIGGVAVAASPADVTPIRIGPDAPSYAVHIDLGVPTDENGFVVIQTRGMAALFNRSDIAPNAYEFRGTIVEKRPSLGTVLGCGAEIRKVVVTRFGDGGEDLALTIAFPQALLRDATLPEVGEDVQGILYLQGEFWSAPDCLS